MAGPASGCTSPFLMPPPGKSAALWLSQENLLLRDLVRNQICFAFGKSDSGYLLIILRLDKYQTATLKTTSVKQLTVCSILSMLLPYEISETTRT